MNVNVLKCPTCYAPLPYPSSQFVVCQYCGSTISISGARLPDITRQSDETWLFPPTRKFLPLTPVGIPLLFFIIDLLVTIAFAPMRLTPPLWLGILVAIGVGILGFFVIMELATKNGESSFNDVYVVSLLFVLCLTAVYPILATVSCVISGWTIWKYIKSQKSLNSNPAESAWRMVRNTLPAVQRGHDTKPVIYGKCPFGAFSDSSVAHCHVDYNMICFNTDSYRPTIGSLLHEMIHARGYCHGGKFDEKVFGPSADTDNLSRWLLKRLQGVIIGREISEKLEYASYE